MLSYKEYVRLVMTEGIINIDKELLSFMEAAFALYLIDQIKIRIKKETVLETLSKLEHKYQLQYNQYATDNIKKTGNSYLELEYNNNGVVGEFNYHLGAKSLDDNNGASFHVGGNGSIPSIKIAIDKSMTMRLNEWLINPIIANFELIIQEKKNQLEHELAHLVEWLLINKPKRIKKNYNNSESDYFTSDIEYEPMIISMIRNVELAVKQFKEKHGEPMTVESYKGLVKDILEGEQYGEIDSVFLLHSKNVTPTKYKNAVKKIYVELISNIEELKTRGFLK